MAEEQVIIDVQINSSEASNRLKTLNASIGVLKERNKELKKAIEEGNDAFGKNSAEMARNEKALKLIQAQQKALNGQIQATTKDTVAMGDSFVEINARAAQLEKQYKALTAAQRESVEGKALREEIIATKQELKEFDEDLGNHQRNVGNYPRSITAMIPGFDKLSGAITSMGLSLDNLGGSLKNQGTALKTFSKTMLTTPIGWMLAGLTALAAIFAKTAEAIKKNDDASTAFAKVFASLKPITTAINKAFEKLAETLGRVANWFADILAGWSDSIAEAQAYVVAVDALEEKERQYSATIEENEAKIAEAREKASDSEEYTLNERKAFLEEALKLEDENYAKRKELAQERLRLKEKEYEDEAKKDDEAKNELQRLANEVTKLEREHNNNIKTLNKQRLSIVRTANNELAQAEKERIAEEAKSREAEEQRVKASNEAILNAVDSWSKELEDVQLRNMAEGEDKQIAEIQLTTRRKLDALKAQYDELGALTAEQQAIYDNLVASINAESLDKQNAIVQEGIAKILADAQALYASYGLNEDEDLTPAERLEQNLAQIQEQFDAIREATQAQLASLNEDQVEAREALNAQLLALDERQAEAENAVREKAQRDALKRQQKEIQMAKGTASAIFGAMDSLADAFAENDEARAKASKGIAVSKALVSSGIAIAEGVASAQAVPFPANIPAIATTVATIAANIATAISTIKSAKFATGGIVEGTSYVGDNVSARVNSGEMVLTREQQTRLFDIANGNNGSSLVNYDAMAQALASAVSNVHPTMVYSEFNDFRTATSNYQEVAKL